MKQLKMCWIVPEEPVNVNLPDGYTIETYRGEEDKAAWCDCCRDGRLIDETKGTAVFDQKIFAFKEIDAFRDVLFLMHQGRAVGTVTAFVREDGDGDVHMVGICPEYRGKGLSGAMIRAAEKKLQRDGVKRVVLTTDEFRKSAVKCYLSQGFLPVDYDTDMKERWAAMLDELGIECVPMLDEAMEKTTVLFRKG